MTRRTVRMGSAGRLVVPADMRSELGFKEGDELLFSVIDGSIQIETRASALARAQRIVAERLDLAGRSLAQELIDERRAEASRDAWTALDAG